MATTLCVPTFDRDPETGCVYDSYCSGRNSFQTCRQAYFLKQQNQILQQQQSESVQKKDTKFEELQKENLELKSQAESLLQINKNLTAQYNKELINRNIVDYSFAVIILFFVVGFLLRKQLANVYKKIRLTKNETERN